MRAQSSGVLVAVTSALVLLFAAPALASTLYYVQGTGDSAAAACAPIAGAPIASERCDSLRAALAAANASPGAGEESDVIFLQAAGTYLLTQAPALTITSDVTIVGRGPRTTTVQGNGSNRVLTVAAGATAGLLRLAVVGGHAADGNGGNILNSGSLLLNHVRVSGGLAVSGGGIANQGTLLVDSSLIHDNDAFSTGGAILNQGGVEEANLSLNNTTVAFNRVTGGSSGAGIASTGNAGNLALLTHVTLARNSVSGTGAGAGLSVAAGSASFSGSIVFGNSAAGSPTNCSGGGISEFTPTNVDNGATCNFALSNQNPQVDDALSDQGGDTDVLTIPSDSSAKNLVAPCSAGVDQRGAPRPSGACDAGAFQEGAVAPPIDSGPEEEPGPLPPTPTPTPTPTPVPTATPTPIATPDPPVFQRTVGVAPVRGTVEICPPRQQCRPLRGGETIPMGSTIDTRRGRVELTSLSSAGGPPQKAQFYDGLFRVTQSGKYTELTLTEKLAPCAKRASAAQSKKPKSRRLWGDGKGKFRTKGQYAAATVRGTRWLVQDTCAGTLVRVKQGSVNVRDNVRRKTVVVRAGKSYTARPRR